MADSTYSRPILDSRRWIFWVAASGTLPRQALPGHERSVVGFDQNGQSAGDSMSPSQSSVRTIITYADSLRERTHNESNSYFESGCFPIINMRTGGSGE